MRQKVDIQKGKTLFARRVEFDLPKKMSEINELRERIRLAQMALMKQTVAQPERSVDTRIK